MILKDPYGSDRKQEGTILSAILNEKTSGTGVLAYGYEAVARGALEADVKVVAGFPGTPSSGCLEALAFRCENGRNPRGVGHQ